MDQAEANYLHFRDMLPGILRLHHGQHALLHNGEIVSYFEVSLDAVKAGYAQFGEGNFSVEAVDDTVEDLGFYSHVGAALHA